jgi:hypothetical protein
MRVALLKSYIDKSIWSYMSGSHLQNYLRASYLQEDIFSLLQEK